MNKKESIKLAELRLIVKKFGYWSKEVREFNDELGFSTMNKINNIALAEHLNQILVLDFK